MHASSKATNSFMPGCMLIGNRCRGVGTYAVDHTGTLKSKTSSGLTVTASATKCVQKDAQSRSACLTVADVTYFFSVS